MYQLYFFPIYVAITVELPKTNNIRVAWVIVEQGIYSTVVKVSVSKQFV